MGCMGYISMKRFVKRRQPIRYSPLGFVASLRVNYNNSKVSASWDEKKTTNRFFPKINMSQVGIFHLLFPGPSFGNICLKFSHKWFRDQFSPAKGFDRDWETAVAIYRNLLRYVSPASIAWVGFSGHLAAVLVSLISRSAIE